MNKKILWLGLSLVLVFAIVIQSCGQTSSSTTQTTTASTTKTTTSQTTTVQTTTTQTTTVQTTSTTTTSSSGNWWDKLGVPKYGGTMTIRNTKDITNFDPYYSTNFVTVESAWMERLFADDWTVDRSVYSFPGIYRPSNFVKGILAESWEFTQPGTFVIHIRKGIHWQNLPPANGRELVADDIAFRWNRILDPATGTFTKGGPFGGSSQLLSLLSVTATDKYTVTLKWKTTNPEFILETVMLSGTSENSIANPEAVKLWGDLNDWHHAIGTGPFMLTDFVSGASATLAKNPDYWGYDERYPKNKLPYVDALKILIIPDDATALAGLRTGKIDDVDQMSYQQVQDTLKNNPELNTIKVPAAFGLTIDPRNDVAPFKDIRVRQALQMSLDLTTIAKTYYSGVVDPWPVALTSAYMAGWGYPYPQWPQALKDEYAYNVAGAKKLLADAGYPSGFKTDIVVDSAYDINLLQIVKSSFSAIGVDMEIRQMDYASWQSFVSTNKKHDQLASVSTGVILGKTIEPIIQVTKFGTTTPNQWTMVSDPVYDTFYPKAIAATSIDEVKQVVKDCNEYIARQHFTVSLMQPMFFSLVQPWLKGYSGENNALFGAGGPTLLFLYPARFWIDQDMKKSMGH